MTDYSDIAALLVHASPQRDPVDIVQDSDDLDALSWLVVEEAHQEVCKLGA